MMTHINLKLTCEWCRTRLSNGKADVLISSNNIDAISEHDQSSRFMTLRDMFVKDAFLVFRSLCKLTMKPLNTERFVAAVRYEHLYNAFS